MEKISVSNVRVETRDNAEAMLVADFSPAPSESWREAFGKRLNSKGFAASDPINDTNVAVYLNGQSGPVEAAIVESAAEANDA